MALAGCTTTTTEKLPLPSVTKMTLFPSINSPRVTCTGGAHEQSDSASNFSQSVCAQPTSQLVRSRSMTHGILGPNHQLYPSSQWATENKLEFSDRRTEVPSSSRPDFVITSLDTRKHNPQSKQIFHIKRINKKPVCSVQWLGAGKEAGSQAPGEATRSEYRTSFQQRPLAEPRHIVHKQEKENKPIDGIVPINITSKTFDVRSEMMLPVCDSTAIPSAHNPHRYLLRKRKVPAPFTACGIVYPNLSRPPAPPTKSTPASGASTPLLCGTDRISVSSLSGYAFSRRKFIQPPSNNIQPGFDGGVPMCESTKFGDTLLPFMKAKSII
ncbi:uncharacterized protein LOC128235386 isoform X2 [Mya arenaria]|uniref:uncharacterized protein LOC128235386 isoform X2 n=1 Tax=Mya arenaria TaxID=6604 RepID=UPI0022E57C32|nr:uncharacterized protein LOC128235386 isoform X2 [Mya arenaria]